jgi:glycosyltransferase involved in cell wall biosynthesis
MRDITLDISRLFGRMLKGRLPTGVDRVTQAYLAHYRPRAFLRWGRWSRVLSRALSEEAVELLLAPSSDPGPGDFREGSVSRGGAENAESFLEMTEGHGAAAPDPEFQRGNGGFQGDGFRSKALRIIARAIASGEPASAEMVGSLFLNTGHSGLERRDYIQGLRARGFRPVFFIHDLIPITHPEYGRPGEADRHRVRMTHALEAGAGLIANSEATLVDLKRFATEAGLRVPPALVALLAPGTEPVAPRPFGDRQNEGPAPSIQSIPSIPSIQSILGDRQPDGLHGPYGLHGRPQILSVPQAARPIAEPYFVMLGTVEPRKNHVFLLQLWRRWVERLGAATPKLVLIGQRGWECENAVDLLERCPALRGAVIEQGRCSDAALAGYLQHAQALLFPSFAEGYGMPLIEALAQGTPVIAGDLPVYREFAGEIPDYLDPLDGPGWIRALEDYAAPAGVLRAAQLSRMRGFQPPTWAAHFAKVDPFLANLDPERLLA